MLSAREILTLQFGNYSNFIGTHWWNLQEFGFSYSKDDNMVSEICNDVLYRQGNTRNDQVTFTPRLLLVELKDSLKHLPLEGELYEGSNIKQIQKQNRNNSGYAQVKEDIPWETSQIDVIATEPSPKHEYQMDLDNVPNVTEVEMNKYNFEESVDSWVDFLYTRYHPRTVNVINEYGYGPEMPNFSTYSNGKELWQTDGFKEDFCDRIRQYVEECDYLQGFQIISDNFNGFAGLASQCLIHLNDEYKRANLTVPVYASNSITSKNDDDITGDVLRLVNSVLSFHEYSEQASLFIPLSMRSTVWRQLGTKQAFPHVNFLCENSYQTSSIIAAYLETITLRYRLTSTMSCTSNTLSAFCVDLNNYGRKLAGAGLALPFPIPDNVDLIDYLNNLEAPYNLYQQLTPHCQLQLDNVVQNVCIRGIPEEKLKRPLEEAQKQCQMAAYSCHSVSEMLLMYLYYISYNAMTHVTSARSPISVRPPYPINMFDSRLTSTGFINNQSDNNAQLKSIPCLAIAQTSSGVKDMLECLINEAKTIKNAKLNNFKTSGLEIEEYDEALESLFKLKNNYDATYDL